MRVQVRAGFTLVELIVVMVMLSTLTALTLPNLIQPQQAASLDASFDTLQRDIRRQQLLAMAGGTAGETAAQPHGVYLDASGYVLFNGSTYAAQDPDNLVIPLEGINVSTTLPASQVAFERLSGQPIGFSAGANEITLSNSSGDSRSFFVNRYGVPTDGSVPTLSCAPTGNALYQKYDGIAGTSLSALYGDANFPGSPSSNQTISGSSLTTSVNIDDNFGARLSALICPSISGDYTFYVAGDDNTELFLSTDTEPANVTLIASVPGWTNYNEWTKYAEQASTPVSLTAGQYYYLEVNYKEGGGGDHATAGWMPPGSASPVPIPNTHYSLPSESDVLEEAQ